MFIWDNVLAEEQEGICPHCKEKTTLHSLFDTFTTVNTKARDFVRVALLACKNCREVSFWYIIEVADNQLNKEKAYYLKIIYPYLDNIEEPHPYMPREVFTIYQEARQTFKTSPRAACALMRLAIEKLYQFFTGESNESLELLIKKAIYDKNIKLSPPLEKALRDTRVTGILSGKPGEILKEDKEENFIQLVTVINLIVGELITDKPRRMMSNYTNKELVDNDLFSEMVEVREIDTKKIKISSPPPNEEAYKELPPLAHYKKEVKAPNPLPEKEEEANNQQTEIKKEEKSGYSEDERPDNEEKSDKIVNKGEEPDDTALEGAKFVPLLDDVEENFFSRIKKV